MASLIYGVRRNSKKGLGCTKTIKLDESQKVKPKSLYVHFVSADTNLIFLHIHKNIQRIRTRFRNLSIMHKFLMIIFLLKDPKL